MRGFLPIFMISYTVDCHSRALSPTQIFQHHRQDRGQWYPLPQTRKWTWEWLQLLALGKKVVSAGARHRTRTQIPVCCAFYQVVMTFCLLCGSALPSISVYPGGSLSLSLFLFLPVCLSVYPSISCSIYPSIHTCKKGPNMQVSLLNKEWNWLLGNSQIAVAGEILLSFKLHKFINLLVIQKHNMSYLSRWK